MSAVSKLLRVGALGFAVVAVFFFAAAFGAVLIGRPTSAAIARVVTGALCLAGAGAFVYVARG